MAPYSASTDADLDASTIAATGAVSLNAPFTGVVTRVSYAPTAAITGAATDNRTLTLVNKGQSGSGTTVVASFAFGAGTSAAAFDEKELTLSVVANATKLVHGDVLEFVSAPVGDGLVDPGGRVLVTVSRD
jgi:hypothetical protein